MKTRLFGSFLALAIYALGALPSQAGVIYTVDFDGAVIDLTGFIETNAVGTFGAPAFDAQVMDFSITASNNGANPFTFTLANSTWGPPGFGSDVDITVTGTAIELLATLGGPNDATNLFLAADAVTNGARENLLIFQNSLRYKLPNPPNTIIFETVQQPFVLATRVPEPASLALLGIGLAGLGFARKKKAH